VSPWAFSPGSDYAQTIVSNPLFVVVYRGAYSVAASIPVGTSRLVAARSALEKRGLRVSWDQTRSKLVASSEKLRASFQAGEDTMRLGNQEIKMSRPAQIIRGTLYIPAPAARAAAALVTESLSKLTIAPTGYSYTYGCRLARRSICFSSVFNQSIHMTAIFFQYHIFQQACSGCGSSLASVYEINEYYGSISLRSSSDGTEILRRGFLETQKLRFQR
jgi:hypothetical protein